MKKKSFVGWTVFDLWGSAEFDSFPSIWTDLEYEKILQLPEQYERGLRKCIITVEEI